jgi:histidine triad (HIT) family protein
MNCIFCKIIRGTEPAQFVARWYDTIAIVPLNPVTEGHVIVMPRLHVENFTTRPDITASTMHWAASLATPPANLITSAGEEATQTVNHLHVHIVPRRKNDGLMLPWSVR